MSVRVAIIYYSSTGTIHRLATTAAEAAGEGGAEVRLRRVAELAPPQAVASRPEWAAHLEATADVPLAELDDLRWADVYLFGTPTRYGNVAAQLKQFLDSTGPLWMAGELAGKVVGGFTGASTLHGGHETTLLALYNTVHHWGGVIVSAGYATPELFQAGNPYGVSALAGRDGTAPTEDDRNAMRSYTGRVLRVGAAVAALNKEEAAA
jgi:NAD(P)H dehydrogenase (quinone)